MNFITLPVQIQLPVGRSQFNSAALLPELQPASCFLSAIIGQMD